MAFGTTPGGVDVLDFELVNTTGETSYTVSGLDLNMTRQVFGTVRATNEAGLNGTAVSNGVYLSPVSSGLLPSGTSYVYDGSRANIDV